MTEIASDNLCFICYTNKRDFITLCKHCYCKECLEKWMTQTMDAKGEVTCPLCRQDISELLAVFPSIQPVQPVPVVPENIHATENFINKFVELPFEKQIMIMDAINKKLKN